MFVKDAYVSTFETHIVWETAKKTVDKRRKTFEIRRFLRTHLLYVRNLFGVTDRFRGGRGRVAHDTWKINRFDVVKNCVSRRRYSTVKNYTRLRSIPCDVKTRLRRPTTNGYRTSSICYMIVDVFMLFTGKRQLSRRTHEPRCRSRER